MKPHKIQLTDAARAAAIALKEEGYALRFSVRSQGCCNLSIRIFPEKDPLNETTGDALPDNILNVDGIHILFDDTYDEFTWVGSIDYKEKGLHKGFHWK
jgi:Fe-S cluster assembly iron-binding protein IscA